MTLKEKAEAKAREYQVGDVCRVWNNGCPNVRYASMQMYEWTKEEVLSEIKRLREKDYPTDTFEEATGYYAALDDIESFLKEEQ